MPSGYRLLYRWPHRFSRELVLIPVDEVDDFLDRENLPQPPTPDSTIGAEERATVQAESDRKALEAALADRVEAWGVYASRRDYAAALGQLLERHADVATRAAEWVAWVTNEVDEARAAAHFLSYPELPTVTDDGVRRRRRQVIRRRPDFPTPWRLV